MRTFGLIPAAGQSRRMGRDKLLLHLGDKSVLEHVIATLRGSGVEYVLVVAAPQADTLVRLASAAGADVLRLSEQTSDMRATCMHGLRWIAEHRQPLDQDGWLLLPADHPTLGGAVVRAILTAAAEIQDQSIIVPSYQGRRGHPTWLRWSHVAAIDQLPPECGLNTFIRERVGATLEMDWPTDEILWDLDTPEDYRRLLDR